MHNIIFLRQRILSQRLDMMRPKIPFFLIRHRLPDNIALVVANGQENGVFAFSLAVVAGGLVLEFYFLFVVVVRYALVDVGFVVFWLDCFLLELDVFIDCF